MKVIEEFTENCRQETLHANGRAYVATWEASQGFVEVPGISEIAVRVDGTDGQPILYMRWLVVDLRTTGGKEATLEALESHSLIGNSSPRPPASSNRFGTPIRIS